jgi:glycerophosphoryl diester phosphodiesterase
VLSTSSPVGAGGWRRAYLRFQVTEDGAGLVRRIRVVGETTSTKWEFGLVAVHREGRPFFAIAHNPDSVERLDRAIADGANALEPDLRHSGDAPELATAEDADIAVTEEGVTGSASAVNGQAPLDAYFRELNAVAQRKLVIWDTKPGDTQDYASVASAIEKVGQEQGFDFSRSVFNISNDKMTALYGPFQDDASIGRCFDGIFTQVHSHAADEWMGPVRAQRLTFQGLGVTPQLQVPEKWSVPISVYVRAREQEEYPKKIYFWTVNDPSATRRILDLGVDGLITDELPRLLDTLKEEPYASIYRYASDDDDHLAKHGGSWFAVANGADLPGE